MTKSSISDVMRLGVLLSDVRCCARGFALRPVFAATVVLTLALGIGVNVAVFSLYDQIMLRELAVSRPDELVKVVSPGPRAGYHLGNQQGPNDEGFSYPLFRDLEAAGEGDVDLAASWIAQVSLGYADRTVRRSAVLVTGDYFSVLGDRSGARAYARPPRRRRFGAARGGRALVRLLDDGFWRGPLGPRYHARRQRSAARDRGCRPARLRRHHARREHRRVRADYPRVVQEPDSAHADPRRPACSPIYMCSAGCGRAFCARRPRDG